MPKIIENLPDRLMCEARRQIEEAGYAATTIRSVAKGCGVGVGTVYNYFSSKEALIAGLMLVDWKNCIAVIDAVATYAEGPQPVMHCIYDQLTAYARRHQPVFCDESAGACFAGSFSRYHGTLRSQLAAPLRRFCESDFHAQFIAESLLTWTMSGKAFDELYGIIAKLL